MRSSSLALDAALRVKRKPVQPIAALDLERASKACASLAHTAREAATAVEISWEQLRDSGALAEAVRYARSRGIELPQADALEAARVLRAYAGAVFLYAGSLRAANSSSTAAPETEPFEVSSLG